MPLYEGLSSMTFITEKNISVIVDFGNDLTKIGFAGESSPRAIIKSEVKCRKTSQIISVFKYQDERELSDHLVDFIYTIYFKYLLVDPKDRRVVILENILGPSLIKNTLCDVLFKHYEVSSVLFLPSHLVALLTLKIPTALVIDIGYKETTILPIYEGIPILKGWQAVPSGSKAIKDSLKELLIDRALCTDSSGNGCRSMNIVLTEKVLEDIKVRCLFVTTINRGKTLRLNKYDRSVEPPPPVSEVQYHIQGNYILTIPGTVYEMASEVLFEMDEDNRDIISAIIESILLCPIDTRKALTENLVIIGGTATMIGMKHRILSELNNNNKMNLYSFKIHQPPAIENYVAWLGGAIYGCTGATAIHSTSKDTYFDTGRIPDWCDLSFNTKDENDNKPT